MSVRLENITNTEYLSRTALQSSSERTAFTVGMWIRLHAFKTSVRNSLFCYTRSFDDSLAVFVDNLVSSPPRWGIWNGYPDSMVIGGGVPRLLQWYYLWFRLTYNATQVSNDKRGLLYLNGSLSPTVTHNAMRFAAAYAADFRIGSETWAGGGGGSNRADASVACVRVWNVDRLPEWARIEMRSPIAVHRTNLLADWPLPNEGDLTDHGLGDNTLTATGTLSQGVAPPFWTPRRILSRRVIGQLYMRRMW